MTLWCAPGPEAHGIQPIFLPTLRKTLEFHSSLSKRHITLDAHEIFLAGDRACISLSSKSQLRDETATDSSVYSVGILSSSANCCSRLPGEREVDDRPWQRNASGDSLVIFDCK